MNASASQTMMTADLIAKRAVILILSILLLAGWSLAWRAIGFAI